MKLQTFIAALILSSFPFSYSYAAPGYVHVSDMSQIDYQLVSGGLVYFRNLNEFNSAATGCCYAFYLDTKTDFGQAAWSVILMKMASSAPLSLYVNQLDPPTSGAPVPIDHLGNW